MLLKKKLTIEYVKEQFEKEGYTLLSTKYINSSEKLESICDKGHKHSISWSKFKQGRRCGVCSGHIKLTYEFVKSEFEKCGYTLLSTKYINNSEKLDYICNRGHKHSISWNKFSRGRRCGVCFGSKKLTYEYVKSEFEKEGYTLLSKEYIGNTSKLDYICPNGHTRSITWHDFDAGKRCKLCFFNRLKVTISGENHYNWKGGVRELGISLFDTYAHQLDFCEQVRRDPDYNDLLQVRCTESGCRKWFTPTRDQVNRRITALNNYNHGECNFYCSEECKENCAIYGQQIHPKGFKPDHSRGVQGQLRDMVLERDGYECQICESHDNLICHHFEGVEQNPIESADVDMCITLCKKCHNAAHAEKGCQYSDLTKRALCAQ